MRRGIRSRGLAGLEPTEAQEQCRKRRIAADRRMGSRRFRPQPADVAIRGATIVDVTDGSLHPDQTVLVDGNSIIAVGSADELSIAPEPDVVDAAGGYLVPGLWDVHAHAAPAAAGLDPGRERLESFFELLLADGITGLREPAISIAGADEERAAVEAGA